MAAGLKLPKVQAPKAPKAPIDPKKLDPAKAQEAAKKAAEGAQKKAVGKVAAFFNPKRLLKIGIILLIALIVFLVVMCKTAWAPGPKDALLKAAEVARDKENKDIETFKSYFSDATIRRLEVAWGMSKDAPTYIPRPGSWELMREGILNSSRQVPKILGEEVQGKQATVTIELDGQARQVQMVLDDEDEWKIEVSLSARSFFRLPPDAPEEVKAKAEEANPSENILWWEDREAAAKAEEEKKKKKKGFFGFLKCSVSPRAAQAGGLDGGLGSQAACFALLLGFYAAHRVRRRPSVQMPSAPMSSETTETTENA